MYIYVCKYRKSTPIYMYACVSTCRRVRLTASKKKGAYIISMCELEYVYRY